MSLKTTVKRTLALLLVLIFALSNMGLAEMADAVADIAAVETSVEETAPADVAPVDEQEAEEAAAPAEEDGGEEADVPMDSEDDGVADAEASESDADAAAPADTEVPAEEPAPADEIAVVVSQLDEHSLWADVTGAADGVEISYQWEVACRDENGEVVWNAVESDNEEASIFSGSVEEVAWYTYRVVVTAGETGVVSDPVMLDPSAYGVAVSVPDDAVAASGIAPIASDDFELGTFEAGTPVEGLTIAVANSSTGKDIVFAEPGQNVYVVVDGGTADHELTFSYTAKSGVNLDEYNVATTWNVYKDAEDMSAGNVEAPGDFIEAPTISNAASQAWNEPEDWDSADKWWQDTKEGSVFVKVTGTAKNSASQKPDIYGWVQVVFLPKLTSTVIAPDIVKNDADGTEFSSKQIGEGEEFVLKYMVASNASKTLSRYYHIEPDVKIVNPAGATDEYAFTVSPVNGKFVGKYASKKRAPVAKSSNTGELLQIKAGVKGAVEKLTEDMNTLVSDAYTILPRPEKLEMLREGAGSFSPAVDDQGTAIITQNIKLLNAVPDSTHSTTGDKATLAIGVDGAYAELSGKFVPDAANDHLVWDGGITWKVTNNEYQSTYKWLKYTNAGADGQPAAGTTKLEVEVEVDPNNVPAEGVPETPEPIVITAEGDYWPKGSSSTQHVVFTWNISVVKPSDKTLGADDIQINKKDNIVGMALAPEDVKPEYSQFKASIKSTSAAKDAKIVWSVKTDEDYGTAIKVVDANEGIFEVLDLANDALSAKNSEIETAFKNGRQVTAKINAHIAGAANAGGDKQLTVIIRPYADGVKLTKGTDTLQATSGNAYEIPYDRESVIKVEPMYDSATDSIGKTVSAATTAYVVRVAEGDDDTTPKTETININNGEIRWTPSVTGDGLGTYKMTIALDTGFVTGKEAADADTYYFNVRKVASPLKIEAERNVLYVDVSSATATAGSAADTLTLGITGSDLTGKNAPYMKGLAWTIDTEDARTTLGTQYIDNTKVYANTGAATASNQKIYLVQGTQGTIGVETAGWGTSDGLTNEILNSQIVVKASYADLPSEDSATFVVKFGKHLTGRPTDFAKVWTLDADWDDTAGSQSGVFEKNTEAYRINQGSTAKATLDYEATGIQGFTADKYPVKFKIEPKSGEDDATLKNYNADGTPVWTNWIAIDKDTGDIEVKQPGDKNKLTSTDDEREFTVTAYVPGLGINFVETRTVRVVSKPTSVEYKIVADNADTSATKTFYSKIPTALAAGDSIKVTAVLHGPKISDGIYMETAADPTIQLAPISGSDISFKADETDGKMSGTWTLKTGTGAKGANAVLKVSDSRYTNLEDKGYTIRIRRDNTLPISGATDCTSNQCNVGGGPHVWSIIQTNEVAGKIGSNSAPSAYTPNTHSKTGHYYICKYCGTVAKLDGDATETAFAHEEFVTVPKTNPETGKPYDDSMFLYRDGQNPNGVDNNSFGTVVCGLCDVTCEHTVPLEKTSAEAPVTRVDATYHRGACPICGLPILEKHVDETGDGKCDICEESSVEPIFKKADGTDEGTTVTILVGGEAYVPNVVVKNANSWKVSYAAKDSTSEQYISVTTNPETKMTEVKGLKPSLTAAVALRATVTAGGTSVTKDLPIVVKEKVLEPSISGDPVDTVNPTKSYIIKETGTDIQHVVKLTVDCGKNANGEKITGADVSDFTWAYCDANGTKVPLATGDSSGMLRFVRWDATEEKYVDIKAADENQYLKGKTEVLVAARQNPSGGDTGDYGVWFGDTNVSCTYLVTVLKQLQHDLPSSGATYSKRVSAAIAINDMPSTTAENNDNIGGSGDTRTAYQITQGDTSATLSLKARDANDKVIDFDNRLVKSVKYEIVPTTTSGADSYGMTKGDIGRWAEVKDGKIVTKDPEKDGFNALSKTRQSMKFRVKATVTLNETEKDSATDELKDKTVVGYRTIEIVPKPAKVVVQQKVVDETGTANWEDVTATIHAMPGEQIMLRAQVIAQDDMPVNLSIAPKFEWPTDKFEEEYNTDTKDYPNNAGVYTLTIKNSVTGTFSIPVTYFGATVAPVQIQMDQPITEIQVNASMQRVSAGEEPIVNGQTTPIESFTVTAKTLPATSKDEIEWSFWYVDKDGKKLERQIPAGTLTTKSVKNGNTYTLTVDVPPTRTDASNITGNVSAGIMFEATAKKSMVNDSTVPMSKGAIVYIYNKGIDNSQLELETAKGSNGVIYLASNESVEITKHGYAQGYGDSAHGTELEPQVGKEYNGLGEVQTTKNSVVKIVPKDGKYYIQPTGLGKAEVFVESWQSVAGSDPTYVKSITVEVGYPIDSVELVPNVLEKSAFEMSVGGIVEIPMNAFAAYHKTSVGETTKKEKDSKVQIDLKAQDPSLVEIKRVGATNWEVKGLKDGTTKLYACVGEKNCADAEMIDITILADLEGVKFYYNGEEAGNQIQVPKGESKEIALTAKVDPATAKGEAKILTPTTVPEGFKVTQDSKKPAEITITTPADGVGILTVEAEIDNPNQTSGGDSVLNPAKFKSHIEIVVYDEEGSTEPDPDDPDDPDNPDDPDIVIGKALKIVGKTQIGPEEKTKIALVGVDKSANITWSVEPVNAVTLAVSSDSLTAEVTGGDTACTAVVKVNDGTAVPIEPIELDVLSGITAGTNVPITVSANEQLRFYPLADGYLKGYSTVDGIEADDLTNVFKFSVGTRYKNAAKYVSVVPNESGSGCKIVGKAPTGKKATQKASIVVTPYNGTPVEIDVTVTKKNTSFNLGGFEDTTQIMKSDDSIVIPVTYKPSTATINLYCDVTPVDDYSDTEETFSYDDTTHTLTTKGAEAGRYEVCMYPEGYDDRAPLSFYVEVCPDAATETGLALHVEKVGIENAFKAQEVSGSVTLVIGEKLQATLVDEAGNAYSGVTWMQSITKAKKQKVALDPKSGIITAKRTGTETITGSAGGNTATLNVTVVNKPAKSQIVVTPKISTTVRMVAWNEPFQLDVQLKKAFPGMGEWKSIEWNGVEPTPVEDKAGCYVFNGSGEEDDISSAIITTSWGQAVGTVNFLIRGEYASQLELPETIELPATGTQIVSIANAEDEYANINWTIGSKTLTTEGKSVKINKQITAKLLTGSVAVEITTKKASGTLEIKATAACDTENTASRTATIVPKGTHTIPDGTELIVGKNVIGVGEKVYIGINSDVVGELTYKITRLSGKGTIAKAKGATLTGSKVGSAKITAVLDGVEYPNTSTTIYVVPKATITYSQKPTKAVVGEYFTIGVTIGGYDKASNAGLSAEAKELVNTLGIIDESCVTTTGPLYLERVIPMPDEEAGEDEDEYRTNAHRYAVVLFAEASTKDANGKNKPATLKIKPAMGKALSTKITIMNDSNVNGYNEVNVNFPDEVYIGSGETITLPVTLIRGSVNVANVDWRFADPAEAASFDLSFDQNGKLKAAKNPRGMGKSTEIIGTVNYIGNDYEEPIEETIPVYIGGKVTNASQFKIIMPKSTIGLNEPVQARVQFTNPAANASGKVIWSSTKKAVATIDKNTGIITAKKLGNTEIRAKIGKYTAKFPLTIGPDMTDIRFNVVELNVDTTKDWYLWDYVTLTGAQKATDKELETAFTFEITENDNDILLGHDSVTGKLFVNSAKDRGTAHVTVTSYNGFSDEILVVLGNGITTGGTVTPPDPDDPNPPKPDKQEPASIELWIKGTQMNADKAAIAMRENDTVTPVVIVKDAQNLEIKEAEIEWETTANVTVTAGVVKAVKTTEGKSVKVTAKVKGTNISESFNMKISAVLGSDHLGLFTDNGTFKKPIDTSIVAKNWSKQPFYFGVSTADGDLLANAKVTEYNWTVENLTPDILLMKEYAVHHDGTKHNIFPGTQAAQTTGMEFQGIKTGDGAIKLTLTYGVAPNETKLEKTISIKVTRLPEPSEITIESDLLDASTNTMTVAEGEKVSFTVKLPEADFGEKPTVDAKACKLKKNPIDEKEQDAPITHTSNEPQVTRNEVADAPVNSFVLDAGTDSNYTKYRVVVKAFENVSKDFIVKVVPAVSDMDDVKVTTEPGHANTATTHDIYAGVGETVKLKVEANKNLYWMQGFTWTKSATSSTSMKYELSETVNGEATLKGMTAGTVTLTIQKNDYSDAPVYVGNSSNTNAFVVHFSAKPTVAAPDKTAISVKYNGNKELPAEIVATADPSVAGGTDVTIGVGETIQATLTFTTGASDPYSNEVYWKAGGSNVVEFIGGEKGNTVTIKGKTSITGSIIVSACTKDADGNELVHHTFKLKVLKALSKLELMNSDATGANLTTYTRTVTSAKSYVAVKIPEGEMGTCRLTCSNGNVTVVQEARNVWSLQVTGSTTKDDIAALNLSCDDLGISESYILKLPQNP